MSCSDWLGSSHLERMDPSPLEVHGPRTGRYGSLMENRVPLPEEEQVEAG